MTAAPDANNILSIGLSVDQREAAPGTISSLADGGFTRGFHRLVLVRLAAQAKPLVGWGRRDGAMSDAEVLSERGIQSALGVQSAFRAYSAFGAWLGFGIRVAVASPLDSRIACPSGENLASLPTRSMFHWCSS